jgi:hypothetical protein
MKHRGPLPHPQKRAIGHYLELDESSYYRLFYHGGDYLILSPYIRLDHRNDLLSSNDNGADFLLVFRFPLPILTPPAASHSSYHRRYMVSAINNNLKTDSSFVKFSCLTLACYM